MRRYLVGGSVRDRLLARELGFDRAPGDRDWVLVGAIRDELVNAGYQEVGREFPVYLHPETREEHALARDADGGFSAHVTLEDDLSRRDLTINAMALDESGELVDPCGGLADLRERRLRHINDHFDDDPLRVLRVARFAAQLPGFTVAAGTIERMRRLARAGTLSSLPAERTFGELRKALAAPSPRRFIEVLRDCGALARWLPEVDALFGVPQPERFHPEIDTGAHLLLALERAAELAPGDPEIGFAVLLHDLGKGVTPTEQWPSHRGHESLGLPLINLVCRRLRAPDSYRALALAVGEYHLHLHRLEQLKPGTVLRLLEGIGAFRDPDRLDRFGIACQADAQGRAGMEDSPYPQGERLQRWFEAAKAVQGRDLVEAGMAAGPELGAALRRERVRRIASLKQADQDSEA